MDDATGLAEALVGLDGFLVLDVRENPDEVSITVETTADVVGCPRCGVRALAKERKRVDIRDLPCFGRPARLVWLKRRWCCADPDCEQKTWTEGSPHVPSRSVLTVRAGDEATRQVGALALPVAVVASELGVCWWTVMDAVELHGTPLVDDPARVGHVRALGIDETSFLSATREHATLYATGMVDLDHPKVIDMIEGNSAADLRRWCAEQDPSWLETIEVVATDLAESYRRGIAGHLEHTVRVADPFHVVRVANRVVDKVRRRVQNETLGHSPDSREDGNGSSPPIRSDGEPAKRNASASSVDSTSTCSIVCELPVRLSAFRGAPPSRSNVGILRSTAVESAPEQRRAQSVLRSRPSGRISFVVESSAPPRRTHQSIRTDRAAIRFPDHRLGTGVGAWAIVRVRPGKRRFRHGAGSTALGRPGGRRTDELRGELDRADRGHGRGPEGDADGEDYDAGDHQQMDAEEQQPPRSSRNPGLCETALMAPPTAALETF